MRLDSLIKWAAIGWTIAIFIGCAWPSDHLSEGLTTNDKFIHISIFGGWGFLWGTVYRQQPVRLFIIGVLYGLAIEIYQLVMPINRSFEWLDLAADSVGIALGLIASVLMLRVVSKG
ncbi:VanZ family protein [Larkinella arboricola]|uniref:VanZ like protein n=1 Tax=Larkinella arboricola TaxID=643671 RepID=A0A327WSD7_LARAB|nr:VanZ family protein [Larkinella arboricola]RAJ94167.1 VanZ like protein [Larkinella arboricola]